VDEDLTKYYRKELNYLRHSAGAFAESHGKIAARLGLSPQGETNDPHVTRLIQSVALLNARIHKKLDDGFPELTQAMLSVLYPHYLAPIPSMSIVRFKSAPDMSNHYLIKRGSCIETQAINGTPCQFRTVYPVTLYPIEIQQAQLIRGSYQAPSIAKHLNANAIIKLTLHCVNPDMRFDALNPAHLDFYLGGANTQANALYQLLFNHVVAIAVAQSTTNSTDPKTEVFYADVNHIEALGFEQEDALLPYPARSFLGYRYLTEFFTFPEKFNFFRLNHLGEKAFQGKGNQVEIYFYLNESIAVQEQSINAENFILGCTPMVNLFTQRAEPIALNHEKTHYPIVPDSRRLLSKEVYQVDQVEAVSPDGEVHRFVPFYGFTHHSDPAQTVNQAKPRYWYCTREMLKQRHGNDIDRGTQMQIALVDINFQEDIPTNWILNIQTTCLNRDLPSRLPFGGGQPKLQLGEGSAPLSRIECLTAPTPTRRMHFEQNALWKLISHLNLNYVSLASGADGVAALQELLTLYNFKQSPDTRAMINGIVNIEQKLVMARVRDQQFSALCRGLEIRLTLDEERFENQNMLLFANVLERFFALYAPLNSFTQLVLKSTQREQPIKTWPPRAGKKIIL